jgi:lipoprotein-anchoring transpeptidase ErfK/SrfK
MQRSIVTGLVVCLFASTAALAQPISSAPGGQVMPATPRMVVMAPGQPQMRGNLGGGFIEFLFGDRGPQPQVSPQQVYPQQVMPQPADPNAAQGGQAVYASTGPAVDPMLEPPGLQIDPRYLRQEVAYQGSEEPGTIVIDTPQHFLYLVEPGAKAMRYGIGVGRPGFTWSGEHTITTKKEWPDWVPPPEMLQRRPDLPHFMAGGPNNPLGARAMYLGSTLYRIHGSNEPWTIGQNVSSGCIRMRNVDIIDLYERVKLGTKVVVL